MAPGGQTITESLPGGDTMTFSVALSGVRMRPTALPVTSSSFLGSADHYSDIDGDPALYQQAAGRSTVTLSGIGIVDAAGDPVSGYSVVTADAESTDAGESITWQSDQSLDLLIHNAVAERPRQRLPRWPDRRGHVDRDLRRNPAPRQPRQGRRSWLPTTRRPSRRSWSSARRRRQSRSASWSRRLS